LACPKFATLLGHPRESCGTPALFSVLEKEEEGEGEEEKKAKHFCLKFHIQASPLG
jgi:hypothetical protein